MKYRNFEDRVEGLLISLAVILLVLMMLIQYTLSFPKLSQFAVRLDRLEGAHWQCQSQE
jgi:hypothetical protein